MATSMTESRRDALLNSVPKPTMARAKPDLNFIQNASRMLRLAIARTGLSQKEAMAALGVEHASQFSEMLDGKQKLWVHALLRPEAHAIWQELIVIAAEECGCEVERTIRIRERRAG
jgi:predicted XRE-type DNA-binding protein